MITGGQHSNGLASKTVHEVHMVVRAALDLAVRRGLFDRNVDHATLAGRRRVTKPAARIWTPAEFAQFLDAASTQRLYPALHLTRTLGCVVARSSGSSGVTLTATRGAHPARGPS